MFRKYYARCDFEDGTTTTIRVNNPTISSLGNTQDYRDAIAVHGKRLRLIFYSY